MFSVRSPVAHETTMLVMGPGRYRFKHDEYEALIRVGNFVAILQAKARRLLAEGHAA